MPPFDEVLGKLILNLAPNYLNEAPMKCVQGAKVETSANLQISQTHIILLISLWAQLSDSFRDSRYKKTGAVVQRCSLSSLKQEDLNPGAF